uniref:Peptidase S1 domain-containing protein n=1 Tax=Lutzomyia longipalpis TaxID=7200 RepID=A0A1B0GLS4_LUTLO
MNTFLCLIVLIGCAVVASAKPRVVGGEEAKPHEFPYMISLQWLDNPEQKHFCGGSILNENWILTAGHCIKAFSNVTGMTEIVAGAHLISQPSQYEQRRKPKSIIVHESYDMANSPGPYDLALIEVDEPFVFNEYVGSLSLPADEPFYPTGSLTITGWGSTSTDEIPEYSDKLLKADVDMVTLEMCYRMYANGPLHDTNLCAGDRYKVPCNCDSGGPLVDIDSAGKVVVYGVVSWSYQPCGVPGKTAVFVNVSYFVNWTQERISSKQN